MPKLRKDPRPHQLREDNCQLDSRDSDVDLVPIKCTAAVGFLFPFPGIAIVTYATKRGDRPNIWGIRGYKVAIETAIGVLKGRSRYQMHLAQG